MSSIDKGKPWFVPHFTNVPPAFQKLLVDRGIPADQTAQHIETVRNKAWLVHTYPCLGEFTFTWIFPAQHEMLPEVLDRLRGGQKLLDFATGLSQDLRYFESQVPTASLTGFDHEQDMLDYSYELFNDRETFSGRLFKADMLDLSTFPMRAEFDIILANCSIHLFSWDDQLIACRTALSLLKPAVNSIIFGVQLGRTSPGLLLRKLFLHDDQSFEKLWNEAAAEFHLTLEISTRFEEMVLGSMKAEDPEILIMFYSIRVTKTES